MDWVDFMTCRMTNVRDHVRRYFNPSGFGAEGFRRVVMLALMAALLGEMVVYILLKESADLGELPYYIPDALIIGISSLEFLLGPFLGWLGFRKRRKVLMMWVALVLAVTVPVFGLPSPEATRDPGLCSVARPLAFTTEIPWRAAVRLALLLSLGLICALAKVVIMAHGLAYLNEFNPSENLHMHVGVFLLHKILLLLMGNIMMKRMTLDMPWLQVLVVVIQLLLTLLLLHRYPVVTPVAEKQRDKEMSVFLSVRRVLGSGVAALQVLAMGLLAASLWGFGINEEAFVKAKYRIVTNYEGQIAMLNVNFLYIPVILGVLLAGYMYTGPVMPKFDRKAAVRNAVTMSLLTAVLYVLMTAGLKCGGEVAGLDSRTYNQPACGQNCACDRPWIDLSPVCVPEQMVTYFSPCHAGCASPDTVAGVKVYSNCTCAAGGRVTVGACDDGSCAESHSLHQLLFVTAALTSSLALVWQTTVVLETVDSRDVSVAVGVASGVVALFAFVGAHGFYLAVSSFTCAFSRGTKCLLQNEQFAPWVGYTSAVLAGLSMVLSLIAFIILKPQKEPKDSSEDLTLS